MDDINNNPHLGTLELDPADGQPYIVELRDELLELLSPWQTVEEVENGFRKLYPDSKLIDLAIKEANKSRTGTQKSHKSRHLSSSSGSSLLHNITSFAAPIINYLVGEGVIGSKSENEVTKFKDNIIKFIIDDVIELTADFVRRQNGNFIMTRSDIRTALFADKDLLDLFGDTKNLLTIVNSPIIAQIGKVTQQQYGKNSSTLTYKQKVRNMVDSENSFIRGLKLIIKVFKTQLESCCFPDPKREVDIIFCNIDELLELSISLLIAFEDALESVGQEDEVPFVGSEILELVQAEEFQAYQTFAENRLGENWRRAFSEILFNNNSSINSIKIGSYSFEVAVRHLLPSYLLNTIIQFFEYFKNFSELYELSKKHGNHDDESALRAAISILTRQKKLIENLLHSNLDQNEIVPLDQKCAETIRVNLERKLDVELQHEKNMPLPYMPPPESYRFSEPDSRENIIFEDHNSRTITQKDLDKQLRGETDHIPVIRCATLIKLVERLTYHKYQPNIVDSFLTTYRSFISEPEELLDLLIERFKIPDPPISVVCQNYHGPLKDLPESQQIAYKRYLRRFRQEYSKPVKMRVVNVLKSWIKNHYYDFEQNPTLLDKLNSFLDEVYENEKILRSLIVSIRKSIEQKKTSQGDDFEFMLSNTPPPIIWGSAKAKDFAMFSLLTIDPEEFARQLTLIEFDLFRAIKPAELINVRDFGLMSRKEEKYESSPNLSKMTKHFTLLSYWVRMCIIEMDVLEKRAEVLLRVIKIMDFLRKLNNFTGLLSIGSAIESAPIRRLRLTDSMMPPEIKNIRRNYENLNANHQRGLENELKQCNPPCIPYLGSYHTKLIHAKEGNKTFINNEVDTTISPTLSNDEFNSSFSNSPATPISPKTPQSRRATNLLSASSLSQNQFFGGNGNFHTHRPAPLQLGFSNNNVENGNNNCSFMSSNGDSQLNHAISTATLFHNHHHQQQPPLTPAPSKMINFTKQRIRANLVAEIGNYQNPPYCLQVQPEIRRFIESIEPKVMLFAKTLPPCNSNDKGKDEDSVSILTTRLDDWLFEKSEKIEPKEPKNIPKPPKPSKSWKSPITK